MTTTRTEIRMEQIWDLVREHPETRKDARLPALRDMVNHFEEYTKTIDRFRENLAIEKEAIENFGMARIDENIMSSSLVQDCATHAAKLGALRRVLECTCKAADDPKSTPVDELIRTLDPKAMDAGR